VASSDHESAFAEGDRVRHQKFGLGTVTMVDGNKLTIDFDSGDRKRVIESFLAKA
jgi:DNA helicase-2/ATP-dependent DNA helicase PcrA